MATLAIGASVWSAAEVQRQTATRAFAEAAAAEAMLIAMLDQETGLRGYLQTGDERFLEPYRKGVQEFELALADAQAGADGDEIAERRAIATQATIARRWQASAARAVASRSHQRSRVMARDSVARKRLMDRFRAANRSAQSTAAVERAERQYDAEIAGVGIAVILSTLFCGVGYVSLVRPWRAVAARDRRRRRFAERSSSRAASRRPTACCVDSSRAPCQGPA